MRRLASPLIVLAIGSVQPRWRAVALTCERIERVMLAGVCVDRDALLTHKGAR